MTAGRIAQHRNYSELMARHDRDIKIRRITKVFLYFLIIVALLVLLLIVTRWEGKQTEMDQTKPVTASVEMGRPLLKPIS